MSDLFPIEPSLSPKLNWLSKHNLATKQNDRTSLPLDPNPWTCANLARTQSAFGATEEEAILEYCAKYQIPHWTIEETINPPTCKKCGTNNQVWRNQLTGKLTCHRVGCHNEGGPEK